MSNNQTNFGKENNDVKLRIQALISNRAGKSPILVGFQFTSDDLVKIVTRIIDDNEVDTSPSVFGVKAEWNSRFEECMRHPAKAPKNVPPFYITVAVRRTLDDQNQVPSKISKVFRKLGEFAPSGAAQAEALVRGDTDLQKAVAMFNGVQNNDWRIIDRKRGVVATPLNPYMVLEYLMKNDVEPGKNYSYDVDIVAVNKNGSKVVRNPENFSFVLIKKFKGHKFKDGRNISSLFRK